jgi:type IV pilus assembly protein PilY1
MDKSPDKAARRASRSGFAVVLIFTIGLAKCIAAQECEVPLFVQQNMYGANVMVLADNSGSMNEAIYHAGYDPDMVYAGNFPSETMYFVTTDGFRAPSAFDATLLAEPVAYFVDSDNGQPARYLGNYLNWIFYHASEEQRAAIPRVTRIQVLKVILHDIIDDSRQLKFGLTVYQNDHGGSIVGKCGVNPTSLHAQIDGITANTWTPTGEALETIVDYFSYDGPDAAIESECQKNFVIIVTDGYPNQDTEVSPYLWDADGDGRDPGSCTSIGAPYPDSENCSDHMDDVAWWLAHTDLRPDLRDDQVVSTYVVGFHVDAPLLAETAANGDGLYFEARNAVELRASIDYALQDILRRISSGSAVAVVSTEREAGDYLYRGKFMPLDWHGYLECFSLPYASGESPVWEAGDLLADRDPNTRDVWTALGTSIYDFAPSSANALNEAMGVVNPDDAAKVISWVVGHDVDGYRPHAGRVLGDIVHATPVVVGAPSTFSPDEDYQRFYEAHINRSHTVYVEANDGMLHAFNGINGEELWAFVPESALPELPVVVDSAYCHVYTCDQTVAVKDVRLDGIWRTMLIGGQGRGGFGLFAIDVTVPSSPVLYWQNTLPDRLAFHSEPVICQVGGDPFVVVGSGLDEVNGTARIHAYDLDTGNLLGSLQLGRSVNARNKTTTPAAVDYDLDGNTDLLYVGDLVGSVWRIDINGTNNPAAWTYYELFDGSQPITAKPSAAFGQNGEVYVYFGTGAYLTEEDMATLDANSFYCVFDRHDGRSSSRNQLVNQTGTIDDIGNSSGWYIDLWNRMGERVTEPALIVAQTVIFTSFAPTTTACVAGGDSWLYRLNYANGDEPAYDDGDGTSGRSESLGEGIASQPVVDIVQGTVVVQSSNSEIIIEEIGVTFPRLVVRAWKEDYDQIAETPPQQ